MKVQSIICGYLEENCYVISNEDKDAIIIDPGEDASKIIKYVKDNDYNSEL